MTDWIKWFSGGDGSKRIFEGIGDAGDDFKVVAEHTRAGAKGRSYVLDDRAKWKRVVDKWRFTPKQDPLSRCGYDYRIVVANGGTSVTVMVCFICDTLTFNHSERYSASKRQVMALLEQDFRQAPASP